MEHKELIKRLGRLAKALTSHIEYPNNGGCGVIAGLVGAEIRKLGLMVEVVTPCGDWYGTPAAVARIGVTRPKSTSDWDSNGLSRTHLAVRFRSNKRTYTWDSDGLVQSCSKFGKGDYTTSNRFGDGLSVDECLLMSSGQRGWNARFDRKQIPLVKHLVRHHLVFGM